MNIKYKVKLSQKEREYADKVLTGENSSKGFKRRASILLMADTNLGKPATQKEIAARCGVCDVTVYNTIKDFCLKGIKYALSFKPPKKRPNPPIVTGEKEARIIALACGSAPEGRSRWTVRLLSEKVVELKIMDAVSYETIRTTLKKHNLSLT